LWKKKLKTFLPSHSYPRKNQAVFETLCVESGTNANHKLQIVCRRYSLRTPYSSIWVIKLFCTLSTVPNAPTTDKKTYERNNKREKICRKRDLIYSINISISNRKENTFSANPTAQREKMTGFPITPPRTDS
jgi:hypothetical protein